MFMEFVMAWVMACLWSGYRVAEGHGWRLELYRWMVI